MHNEHFCNSNSNSDSDDRLVGQRLKRAARDDGPEFSADLHARIMGAIALQANAEAVLPAKPRGARRTVASWVAIAAGLLIALAGAAELWNVGGKPQSPRQTSVAVTPAPSRNDSIPTEAPPAAADTLAAAANSPSVDFSLDDLDRTASQAVRLVVDQLPIDVPTDGWDFSSAE